jgi:hypothetical protein
MLIAVSGKRCPTLASGRDSPAIFDSPHSHTLFSSADVAQEDSGLFSLAARMLIPRSSVLFAGQTVSGNKVIALGCAAAL